MLRLDDLLEARELPPGKEQSKFRDKRLAKQAVLSNPGTASGLSRSRGGMVAWILFIALAAILIVLLRKQPQATPPAPARAPLPSDLPEPVDLWLSVIPSALGAAGVGMFVLAVDAANRINRRRREKGGPVTDAASRRAIMCGLGTTLVLVVLSVWVMVNPLFEIVWRPQRWHVAIAAATPWAIVFAAMYIAFRNAERHAMQTKFATHPTFGREHTSRLNAEGLHQDDGVTQALYRWPIFTRAWETDHLLVLEDEVRRRHMLPKRVLADAGQLEVARAWIVSRVSESDLFFTPGAFPVNRAPAAPIPAIPILPADPTPHGGRAD